MGPGLPPRRSASALGGWVGAKFAVRGGEKWIRIVMIIAAIALALNLLGVWEWLF